MAPSIGQYAPVFLPGEPLSATEKPGRPRSTGLQRVRHSRSDPVHIDARLFFACGSSAPGRFEHEGGASAWLAGTLVATSVQGQGLPLWQALWPHQSLFSSLLQPAIRRPLGQSFSISPLIQALRGLPCLESFSVVWRGRPNLQSYPVDPLIRHLKGHPGWGPAPKFSTLFSCHAGRRGEAGFGDGSTPYT